MGRRKDWEEIVFGLLMDQGEVLRKIKKRCSKVVRAIGEGRHIKDPGQFLEDVGLLTRAIGKADALGKSARDIVENKNNNKTAADIEERVRKKAP